MKGKPVPKISNTQKKIDQLKKELAGYTVSKGTIQFAKEKPFPVALLKKILKARIAARAAAAQS